MLETSEYLGTRRYKEPEDLRARIGYTDPPTHISTFTGVGGFDLGFAQAGYETLVAIEPDQEAADTYRLNLVNGFDEHLDQDFPPVLLERDIREIAT